MKRRTVRGAILAFALAVPSAATAQDAPEWALSAEPLVQIGVVEGDPAYQFFNVTGAVRLDDGRIVVLNAGSHELRMYDADGRMIRSVGREGGGPGEFSRPARLYRLGRDSLMVYDRGNGRFTVHTTDGDFVRSEPAEQERGRAVYDEWLYNRSWIDGPPRGRGRGPVRAAIDGLPAPDEAAGYRYVKVSPQGHLWVRRPNPTGAVVVWTVYDLDARPIGRVAAPARFEIHDVGRDYVLGVGRDELDVEYVQLFDLGGAEGVPGRVLAGVDGADAPAPRSIPDDVMGAMRAALRQLLSRQEIFYSTELTYAGDIRQLEDVELPGELLVRIVRASDRGWTGLMIDRRSGSTCGVSVGWLTPVGWMPGTVTCDSR